MTEENPIQITHKLYGPDGPSFCTRALGRLNYVLLLLYAVGMGLHLVVMPKYIDDYWFMELLRPWFEAQGIVNPDGGGNIFKAGIPLSEILQTWNWHYHYDNIRLGNMVVVIFLLFPKWLGSGLALSAWMYAVVRGFTLAGVDWRRSSLVPVGLALYYVLLPWHDNFASMDYQFNYIVPAGGVVWLLMRLGRRRSGITWWTGTVVLGALVGWWHEGLGVPLACGLVILMFYRQYRSVGLAATILAIAAAVLVTLHTPGMSQRASDGITLIKPLALWFVTGLMAQEWVFFVDILLGLVLLAGCRRREVTGPRFTVPVAICLGSCAIMYAFFLEPRVGWMCGQFSIVLFVALLALVFPKSRGYTPLVACGALALMGLIYCSMSLVAVETFRLRRQEDRIIKTILARKDVSFIFAPHKYQSEKSPLLMNGPVQMWGGTGQMYLYHYYRRDEGLDRAYLIPEELRDVRADSGVAMPGGYGWRIYKGKYFRPSEGEKYSCYGAMAMMDFGKGFTYAPCTVSVFRSEADGRDYLFLEPKLTWYVTHFKRLRAIGVCDLRRWEECE